MTDRELLELAAKAAKVPAYWSVDGTVQNRPMFVVKAGGKMGTMPYEAEWNPLKDDAEALRLAVKLGLDKKLPHLLQGDAYRTDYLALGAYAATRRAIVRAAAEIGKTRSD